MKKVVRTNVQKGYDMWAHSYDETPNPLVVLDRRHTLPMLNPRAGEVILDAACGTGANMQAIARSRSAAIGLDLSLGMLRVARGQCRGARLAQANLEEEIPVRKKSCDAVLCALAGEHMQNLKGFFGAAFSVVKCGGRIVFSVFHPDRAADGRECNFDHEGVNYRLGAVRHTVGDYMESMWDAGFRRVRAEEFEVDEQLGRDIPRAEKYVGKPLLLVVEGRRQRNGSR